MNPSTRLAPSGGHVAPRRRAPIGRSMIFVAVHP